MRLYNVDNTFVLHSISHIYNNTMFYVLCGNRAHKIFTRSDEDDVPPLALWLTRSDIVVEVDE